MKTKLWFEANFLKNNVFRFGRLAAVNDVQSILKSNYFFSVYIPPPSIKYPIGLARPNFLIRAIHARNMRLS